jgi:hypothetical protein
MVMLALMNRARQARRGATVVPRLATPTGTATASPMTKTPAPMKAAHPKLRAALTPMAMGRAIAKMAVPLNRVYLGTAAVRYLVAGKTVTATACAMVRTNARMSQACPISPAVPNGTARVEATALVTVGVTAMMPATPATAMAMASLTT